MAAKKSKRSSRKAKTKAPAHPDLGKEFYIASYDDYEDSGNLMASNVKDGVEDAVRSINDMYGVGDPPEQGCRILKVRVVAVGVDTTPEQVDRYTWHTSTK